MNKKIQVLIVDDHLVVREGLRLILESEEGFEVVGEAADGAAALRAVEKLSPDVVLMDLRMPGMDGLEALEKLSARPRQVAVVVLTTFNEDELMARAIRAGARGYLLKDTSRQVLLETVRAASRGEMLVKPELLTKLLEQSAKAKQQGPLSERELEVLEAVARGERNKEIADGLGVSERTVKAHLTNVFNKLGVDSRAGAVAAALRMKLISGGSGLPG